MEQYKQEFIEFMVESHVLKFGEFTLKSGRKSPFFMNAGAYVTGDQLHRLGLSGKEVKYCSNRKEAKDHGEGGNLLGHVLEDGDRVVMVEDVTTSGKSIDETYPLITGAANIEVKGLMVSLNRMEVGKGGVKCACDEVSEKYGFPTASIVNMAEVTEYLYNREVQGVVLINDDIKAALDAYYEEWGAKE